MCLWCWLNVNLLSSPTKSWLQPRITSVSPTRLVKGASPLCILVKYTIRCNIIPQKTSSALVFVIVGFTSKGVWSVRLWPFWGLIQLMLTRFSSCLVIAEAGHQEDDSPGNQGILGRASSSDPCSSHQFGIFLILLCLSSALVPSIWKSEWLPIDWFVSEDMNIKCSTEDFPLTKS